MTTQEPQTENARERLLSKLPLTERRLQVAGVSTAVLAGGVGRSIPGRTPEAP